MSARALRSRRTLTASPAQHPEAEAETNASIEAVPPTLPTLAPCAIPVTLVNVSDTPPIVSVESVAVSSVEALV